MRIIDADTVVTIMVFDEMYEEYNLRTMTIAEALDLWTEEGCPSSVDAVIHEEYYDALANKITDMEERGFVQVVRCKDCRWQQDDYMGTWCSRLSGVRFTNADDYCSHGERRSNKGEEINGFKSVGQAWNTSQGRWEP